MSARDNGWRSHISASLERLEQDIGPLLGIQNEQNRSALICQMIDSIHRVEYIRILRTRDISSSRKDPGSIHFNPYKAALLHQRSGALDDAFWIVFLAIHFGKHRKAGWRYVREIYGLLGTGLLDWSSIRSDLAAFKAWLQDQLEFLQRANEGQRGFGNHRKYESLAETAKVFDSYVRWVGESGHQSLFDLALRRSQYDARKAFDDLYKSMESVTRFGRTARFDFLCMVGKLGLANVSPGSPYLVGSTGPLSGARLLFFNNPDSRETTIQIEAHLHKLDNLLDLDFGMQILEDALCNWQKTPDRFARFRG